MNWHKAIALISMFLTGPSSAWPSDKDKIWFGLSFEASSFAKEVTRLELAKALVNLHVESVLTEAGALAAAQWYAEEVLPRTSREKLTDGATWKSASIEKLNFNGKGTTAFVVELIPPIPESGIEGLTGIARLLVAENGSVFDVTSKQPDVSFRSPLRIPFLVKIRPATSINSTPVAKP